MKRRGLAILLLIAAGVSLFALATALLPGPTYAQDVCVEGESDAVIASHLLRSGRGFESITPHKVVPGDLGLISAPAAAFRRSRELLIGTVVGQYLEVRGADFDGEQHALLVTVIQPETGASRAVAQGIFLLCEQGVPWRFRHPIIFSEFVTGRRYALLVGETYYEGIPWSDPRYALEVDRSGGLAPLWAESPMREFAGTALDQLRAAFYTARGGVLPP